MAFLFFLKYIVLALTYFRSEELSSVLMGLIALFGMGRDVSPSSKHQNTIFKVLIFVWFANFLTGIETLVLLSSTHYCAYT